jgi:hypothetical protein
MSVFSGTLFHTTKKTLSGIIDDKHDGFEADLIHPQWMEQKTMTDQYEDDLEVAGPGLVAEKMEGQEMASGEMREGLLFRYYARIFAMKMLITEEAVEDNKYPETIKLALRLKRALYRTQDFDTTLMLMRAFSAAFPIAATGVPLCSASQPLPYGGVFSNTSGAPASPSVASVIAAESAVRKYPGLDGTVEGYNLKTVVFPTEQWASWEIILGSEFTPTANNFAEINVVNKKLKLKLVPNKYWANTTSNYLFLTTAEDGPQFRMRRKPKSRTWVENSQEVAAYGISSRWGYGTSNARAVFGVNA